MTEKTESVLQTLKFLTDHQFSKPGIIITVFCQNMAVRVDISILDGIVSEWHPAPGQ